MSLEFHNPSRSYDGAKERIHFWGYDGPMEVPFSMEIAAIFKLAPKTKNAEESILSSFDAVRARIVSVAEGLYRRGPRRFYLLTAGDFT